MQYTVPGVWEIQLDTIILDLNGTLTVHGVIPIGVKERIHSLRWLGYNIVLLTGDQRGTAKDICRELDINFQIAKSLEEKANCSAVYDPERVVAIGNARIDIGTFKHARVRIATLQSEWIHTGIIEHIDIIVPTIVDAFDLLLDADTFAATMRL